MLPVAAKEHGRVIAAGRLPDSAARKPCLDSLPSVSNVPCFMKQFFSSLIAVGVCGTLLAADQNPAAPAQFKDSRDKTSYSLGVNIGNSMKMQGAEVNPDEVASGLRDAISGKAKLTEQEVRETLMAWQQELRSKRMEKM